MRLTLSKKTVVLVLTITTLVLTFIFAVQLLPEQNFLQSQNDATHESSDTELSTIRSSETSGRHFYEFEIPNNSDEKKKPVARATYSRIYCTINGGDRPNAQCLKDLNGEVYLPFDGFLRDFFEVDGSIRRRQDNDAEVFEFWTTKTKISVPDFKKYNPSGPFGLFANYNVENRDRVKLISGIYGVPLSVQWQSTPYHYPVQIAQFALEHYSKNVTEPKVSEMLLLKNDWYGSQAVGSRSSYAYVNDTKIGSTVLQFNTSLNEPGVFTNFSRDDVQNWPVVRIFISFSHPSMKHAKYSTGFTILVEKTDTRTFYYMHYVDSDELLRVVQPNHIFYGVGKSCCETYHRFTRNIITDLSKGFALLQGKKKGGSKIHASLLRAVSFSVKGSGRLLSLAHRSSSHEDNFFDAVDFLLQSQDEEGGLPVPVMRSLANGRLVLKPGWRSAMAQGHFMSAACRAYFVTGYQKYREAAVKATKVFYLNSTKNGIRAFFLNKTVWFEEYPTRPQGTFVLNGFIYALIGLYDSWQLCGDDVASKDLFELGLQSLKTLLPLFDTGAGSIYDLRHVSLAGDGLAPNLARWDYHAVHIYQLLWLYAIDKDDLFRRTAKRWINYAKGRRAKHN